MHSELEDKINKLKEYIKALGKVGIAFSGGVDSTFLLKVAMDAAGEDVNAFTIKSVFIPMKEFLEAQNLAEVSGVKLNVIEADVLSINSIASNPKDRCYYCKRNIFEAIIKEANLKGIYSVLDGTNADDTKEYRPGVKALKELKIKSPLMELGFTKKDIREASKFLGLSTYNKPAMACLATRFPYNSALNEKDLLMVEKGEDYLRSKGLVQVRLRHHKDIARIEVSMDERKKFFDEVFMDEVNEELIKLGYKHITLDIGGYKVGNA